MPRDLMYAAEWAKAMEDASAGYRQQKTIEAQQAELERKAQLAQEQDKLAAYLKGQQTNADVEAAMQLRGQLPAGSSVRIGEASVSSPSPLESYIKQQSVQDRQLDNERLETKAIQDEFRKLGGFEAKQIQALDDVDALAAQNDLRTFGQLQGALFRLRESGVATDKDIERYMPRTAKRDLQRLGHYFGLSSDVTGSPLTPADLAGLRRFVAEKKANLVLANERANQELGSRASTLAPTLSKSGKIGGVMQGLGGVTKAAAGQQDVGKDKDAMKRPQAAQSNRKPRMSFEEFKAMKRAKNGP